MKKELDIKTIERMMESPNYQMRLAAMKACANNSKTTLDLIAKGLRDQHFEIGQAAENAFCKLYGDVDVFMEDADPIIRCAQVLHLKKKQEENPGDISDDFLRKAFSDSAHNVRFYTAELYALLEDPHEELMGELLSKPDTDVLATVAVYATILRCRSFHECIPKEILVRGLNASHDFLLLEEAKKSLGESFYSRESILYILDNVTEKTSRAAIIKWCIKELCPIPEHIIFEGLRNEETSDEMAEAFVMSRPDKDTIQRFMTSEDEVIRFAAINACFGRNDGIPFSVVLAGTEDASCRVRQEAVRVCSCVAFRQYVTAKMLEKWISDPDVKDAAVFVLNHIFDTKIYLGLLSSNKVFVRYTAAKVFRGKQKAGEINDKEGAKEVIHAILSDNDHSIREIAMEKPARTFEPPNEVFVDCLGSAVAVLKIPEYATVRGVPGNICKTNAAEVEDIVGDLYGEKICIPVWDLEQVFSIGESLKAKDDDHLIQFYCTREEAYKAKNKAKD